jgi:molybdopterin-guanine dinucleotide biosynthesis protein A
MVHSGEYTAADLQAWLGQGEPSLSELVRMRDVEYVDLPGGH